MPCPAPRRNRWKPAIMHRVSLKLVLGLVACLAAAFVGVGIANQRLLRGNLEERAVVSARTMADIIFRSTRHGMMRNHRGDIIEVIRSIGVQEGVRAIRIYDKAGSIQYSTLAGEIGTKVNTRAEACFACHATSAPLEKPDGRNTVRIYGGGQERLMGLIRPIENEPGCWQAACHAHEEDQRVLGVLDVVLSLKRVDENLATQERRLLGQVWMAALVMLAAVSLFVWRWVVRPVSRLREGIKKFGKGELSFRFPMPGPDEFGHVERTFNSMAEELEMSSQTLEVRIAQKTKQLEDTQQRLIHSERLASLGELAASVAHELNNPLAGILTYARLLERKLAPEKPALEWLQTIQHESFRCGEIVNNLLVFARSQETRLAETSMQDVLNRTVAVVRHKFEMQNARIELEDSGPVRLVADAGQLQQVFLAILVNALEAIAQDPTLRSGGGYARIRVSQPAPGLVEVAISNNGPSIPDEAMPRLFEPFFSTKGAMSGVGLGLSVAYGVVQRHHGEIHVSTGAETTFTVQLPLSQEECAAELSMEVKS